MSTASVTDPLVFHLLADVVIPAGASPPQAVGTLEHSEPQDELFASTGLPNQDLILLPATPYLDGSAEVSAGNGPYVEVQNFLGSTAADRHFTLVVAQNDRAAVIEPIRKYPRTPHLEGSRLQPGDSDLEQVPLKDLRGRFIVVEEKLDGANAGISLGPDGALRLQSRGHFLTGGGRERHFDLLKQWAAVHAIGLRPLLGGGRVLHGEWLFARHTIFYDRLPHYFLEFDIADADGMFWSTTRRRQMLRGVPFVCSVPVIWEGVLEDPATLPTLMARSPYKSPRWREALAEAAGGAGVDSARVACETDPSDEAEGLYIKVEENGQVAERYKWVRASFLTSVTDSGSHWLSRPIIPNQLDHGVDLFAPAKDVP